MNDQNSPLSLSKQELRKVNKTHIYGIDKLFRMYSTVSSKINKVEDGIIYLSVVYSSKKNTERGKDMAEIWINNSKNEILQHADKIVVKESFNGEPAGAAFVGKGHVKKEDIKKILEQNKSSSGSTHIRTTTYEVDELIGD